MNKIAYPSESVLITGASSGIGAEFARQVAARGADVVLSARRRDRLEKLATELSERYGVIATAMPVDLSQPRIGQVLRTELAAQGIRVTSLINCAGFATQGPFHNEDPARLQTEIAVDVSSVVDISRAFINPMRERGAGFLVNVASMAAYQANPTMAVYGATKAFILNFTEALAYESRGTGVRVMVLSPGATDTEFFDVAGQAAGGGASRMQADQVVRTALNSLDRRNPPPAVIAGRANRFAATFVRLIGRRRSTMIIGSLMAREAR